MVRRLGLICLVIALNCGTGTPVSARADEEKKHAIDIWMDKQMEKDPSTMGQRHAINGAHEKWEAEVSAAYKKLLVHLKPSQQTLLRDAQRKWLAYRDAEFELNIATIGRRRGTMWLPILDHKRMSIVRARALQLIASNRLYEE